MINKFREVHPDLRPEQEELLFSIDADPGIENGFYSAPDCKDGRRLADGASYYCGSRIGCAGDSGAIFGDGGGDGGFFDGLGGDSDGGGC